MCFTKRVSLQLETIDGLTAQNSRPIFILCMCTRISVHALIKSDSLTNTALIRAIVSDVHLLDDAVTTQVGPGEDSSVPDCDSEHKGEKVKSIYLWIKK